MLARPLLVFAAVLLCLVGIALYAWTGWQPSAPTRDPAPAGQATNTQQPNDRPAEAATPANGAPAAAGPMRTETTTIRSEATAADQLQGLRGRVQDIVGQALPNATVHLVESASNDPLLLPLVHRQRHLLAPVATADPRLDGTFTVGLAVAQDKIYDLFVVSQRHATLRLTGLRLVAGSWHDLGNLTLHEGTTLRGRVTIAGSPNLPVPQAVVSVTTGGAFADAALRAMPEDQGALIAHADHDGFYELPHAPTIGIVRVEAIAPGFARVIQYEVEMVAPGPVEVNFALPPGKTMLGDVRTKTGIPVAAARIEAWPDKANRPPLLARSDEQGRFVLHGLREGPHRVRVRAKGFAVVEQPGVTPLPGTLVHLVMEPARRIQVSVRTDAGRVLRAYRLGLRRFFASDLSAPLGEASLATGRIGALPQVADQRVRLDTATDYAEIGGVPDGTFVCVVTAEGFAKTLSTPIQLSRETHVPGAVVRLEMVVNAGHLLRGQVVDDDGSPLAFATVKTQTNGTMPDSPVMRVLQAALPQKISGRTVQTDERGFFELSQIALATYQLQVSHPDACRALVRNIDCTRIGQTTLPPVRLARGSNIRGRATVAGRVQGQIKLVLTSPATAKAERSLRLETVTDGEGHYRFARRIPPGTYLLRAAVVGSQSADSEIFQQLLQLKRSSTTLLVPPGQDVVQHDLNLPAAN